MNTFCMYICIFPLALFGLKSSINFWNHVISAKSSKLVKKAYNDSIILQKGFGANLKLLLQKNWF